MTRHAAIVETPLGPATAFVDDAGRLVRFTFGPVDATAGAAAPEAASQGLARVARQVAEYFAGTRRSFDLELAPDGTGFQLAVWRQLRRIPFGTTASYGDIAAALGRPGAARAVGRANGANPIALIVPCHRVIGSDGGLTGYAGGLPLKRALLDFERPAATAQAELFAVQAER